VQGGQRLAIAGDLDGARRAYALAAQVLDRVATPEMLDLRQALVQERRQLDAASADPRADAAAALDAVADALQRLPLEPAGNAPRLPWWRRIASRIVDVRPSTASAPALPPADRGAALAALELELSLARATLERRDEDAFRRVLARIDGWTTRLWPPSPARQAQRARLRALQRQSLVLDIPTLGTTLEALRRLRDAR
jgi:uroporphyrin-III C-methyltransferase